MSLGKIKSIISTLKRDSLDNFVIAGYGGIGVNAPAALASPINSTFQQLVDFDTNLRTSPRGVDQNFNNDGLIFLVEGIWQLNIKIALTFDDLNAGRQLSIRIYNATTATAGTTLFNYFVGRDQAGVNIPLTASFEVPESVIGDIIALQIGSSSDTFNNVTNIGTILEATHVSEAEFL